MAQPLHLIANEGLGMPVSIWFSPDIILKPQLSEQIAVAYNRNITLKNQRFSFGFDTYYKTLKNIPSYADGYSFDYYLKAFYSHENIYLNRVMTIRYGKSYGLEFRNCLSLNYSINFIVQPFSFGETASLSSGLFYYVLHFPWVDTHGYSD